MKTSKHHHSITVLCSHVVQVLKRLPTTFLQRNLSMRAIKAEKFKGTHPLAFPAMCVMKEERLETEGKAQSA